MKLSKPKSTTTTTTTTPSTTTTNSDGQSKAKMKSMLSAEKKLKKEIKSHQHKSSAPTDVNDIEPPRLHRDMRLICDIFRISEQSRYALRSFDAATLEDFCLMTDEDFADLILTQARIGRPIPPLQQRKLRVILTWIQSLAKAENLDKAEEEVLSSPTTAEGVELSESQDIKAAKYQVKPRKGSGTFIPATWEDTFYKDLPGLRKELKHLGEQRTTSNWANGFLSLRWMFCGYNE